MVIEIDGGLVASELLSFSGGVAICWGIADDASETEGRPPPKRSMAKASGIVAKSA